MEGGTAAQVCVSHCAENNCEQYVHTMRVKLIRQFNTRMTDIDLHLFRSHFCRCHCRLLICLISGGREQALQSLTPGA
eukprot:COSAG05_NODE_238_length_13155_cov_489.969899_9_plen_78_part_00